MLSETRAELQDFQATSKDLEDELVKELERTEKTQQELKVKVARAEGERDEWKVLYQFYNISTLANCFSLNSYLFKRHTIRRQRHYNGS